jgi:hypothetical protein
MPDTSYTAIAHERKADLFLLSGDCRKEEHQRSLFLDCAPDTFGPTELFNGRLRLAIAQVICLLAACH